MAVRTCTVCGVTDPTPTPTAADADGDRISAALRDLISLRSVQERRAAFESALQTVTRRSE